LDYNGVGRVISARGLATAHTLGIVTSDSRLDLFKTLGDNTRYAIYLELARSATPLSTAEIADTTGLHMNTVRPHLERMRDVGLLEVRPDSSGSVGRPQKLYFVAEDAPSLGLEPPLMPMLAQMLLSVAVDSGAQTETVLAAGRQAGTKLSHQHSGGCCSEAMMSALVRLGFDPASATEDDRTAVAFGNCPFAELAESEPQVICALHQGVMEGFAAEWNSDSTPKGTAELVEFNGLGSRTPCTAELVD